MTPAEERSEDWARSHRSPETARAVEYRRKVCRACLCCNGIEGDVVACAKTVKAPVLTIEGACPIRLW